MRVTALLMAGGKGTRLKAGIEKPMLKLYRRPLIEYVLNALMGAREVSDIIVTVSIYTRKTKEYIKRYPVTIVKTSGEDWHLDMKYTVKKLRLDKVLIISADTPFLTSKMIDDILRRYKKSEKPALMVATPLETRKRLGLSIDFIVKIGDEVFVPAGINVIDGRRIDEGMMNEDVLIIDDERVAVNINTLRDLRIARELYKRFVKA